MLAILWIDKFEILRVQLVHLFKCTVWNAWSVAKRTVYLFVAFQQAYERKSVVICCKKAKSETNNSHACDNRKEEHAIFLFTLGYKEFVSHTIFCICTSNGTYIGINDTRYRQY